MCIEQEHLASQMSADGAHERSRRGAKCHIVSRCYNHLAERKMDPHPHHHHHHHPPPPAHPHSLQPPHGEKEPPPPSPPPPPHPHGKREKIRRKKAETWTDRQREMDRQPGTQAGRQVKRMDQRKDRQRQKSTVQLNSTFIHPTRGRSVRHQNRNSKTTRIRID